MKLKNLIINVLLLLPLTGYPFPTLASPPTATPSSIASPTGNSPATATPVFTDTLLMNSPLTQEIAPSYLGLDIAESEAYTKKVRKPLPKSFYTIRFCATDGLCRRHIGVAIQGNALLSSNHFLPRKLSPGDVTRIQISNSYSDVHEIDNTEDFLIRQEGGYTIIVLKENVIPENNIASLGDVDSLTKGDDAYQAVVNGAPAGIYPTKIKGPLTVLSSSSREYQAITVFYDRTITGDSGSPLYVNGVVYGVNNSGDGIYGAVTDPGQIYQTINNISTRLNRQKNQLVLQQH